MGSRNGESPRIGRAATRFDRVRSSQWQYLYLFQRERYLAHLMLGNLKPAVQAAVNGQKKLAKYAFDEIERIINVYGKEIV